VTYRDQLEGQDLRVLALRDSLDERGLLELDDVERHDLVELLHQGDRDDAWVILAGGISVPDEVTEADRQELVALLLDGESEESFSRHFGVSAVAHVEQILTRSPGEPFPYLT
jgi:hypothetical protein